MRVTATRTFFFSTVRYRTRLTSVRGKAFPIFFLMTPARVKLLGRTLGRFRRRDAHVTRFDHDVFHVDRELHRDR